MFFHLYINNSSTTPTHLQTETVLFIITHKREMYIFRQKYYLKKIYRLIFVTMTHIDALTPISRLEQLKVGDLISDAWGSSGAIKTIEVLKGRTYLNYYFRIKSGKLILALR